MTDNIEHTAAVPADLLPALLNRIPYAVAMVDTQMRYVAHSRRWLDAFHLPEQSLVGRSHYEVFPEIGEEWKRIHRKCLAGAEFSREDDPFPRHDGSVDYVSWSVSPWRLAGGEIAGMFMFTTVSTAQVVAEKRNRQYERELKTLLQITRAVPWRMEIDSGTFSYMGPQVESLLGYPANSWADMETWALRIHEADRDWAVALCRDKTARGLDHDFEYRALTRSGETIWLRDAVTVIKNEQGEAIALAGLFIDISEQKRTEQRLRHSEAKYRSVIETSGDGFWLTNMHGYLLETNDAYARLSGYSKEELVGMHISDVEALEQPEETEQHIKAVIESGYEIFETRHRRKDGSLWDVEVSTSFTHSNGGRFFAFCRDITERKRTQQELRLIAEVFKNTSEGIVITDPDGIIVDVNPAYCEITGYSRDEMIGSKPSKIKSDRHDAAFYRHMWHCLQEEGYWVGEIWDRRKNGEVFPKWLSINAVHDENDTLSHYVGTFSDISVLKGIEKELEYMAYYDPLTGLPNRILFKDRLENELSNCRRFAARCAVLFLDLDRFKLINDTLGHTAGDELLIAVAKRLQKSVRGNDTVARLGGDEFTLLLSQLKSTDAAALVAQNIIEQLAQPITLHGEELRVGASVGIAIYPEDGENFTNLTRHADAAMYEAKASGKGQYRFFSEYMDQTAHEHLSLERDLHLALEEDQFFLVFQPQIHAHSGRTVQCEALIRWQHPQRGLVSPDQFIGIAEDTGLIHPIGDWVIREVCRQISHWRGQGVEVPTVAINLSARQFRQEGLVERIMKLLRKYRIGVEAIEFEITESVAMEHAESTMRRLTALSSHGFSIAIDDFGTGYSSLSYLKRFPVQKLKLDRSFVRDIEDDANDAAISAAVISMAHSLGLEVVAEGVETAEQRDFLMGQGCRIMQGYLYSKPLSSSDFLAYLTEK
jgi:diguanylate cyclase (GGDEF)-like protein/PAS domain S-box-containing protein